MTQFGWILDVFEDCSILAEKQQLKPRKSNSLMSFASLDTQLDPQVAILAEWNESGVKNLLWRAIPLANQIHQKSVLDLLQATGN